MNSAIDIKIRQLIKDKLGIDESRITKDATFRDDLEVDSLDFTELIVGIEKEFKITIPDEAHEKVKTVGALTVYVAKLVDPYSNDQEEVVILAEEPELEEQDA